MSSWVCVIQWDCLACQSLLGNSQSTLVCHMGSWEHLGLCWAKPAPDGTPLHSCGCTVVFPCLLNQRVVLWSSSVSYLTGKVTGPDCVGVGSNCSHIRKPPSLQSAAGICFWIAVPCMRLENREKNPESLKLQDAGTFRGARAQKTHSKCSLLKVEFRNFRAKGWI